MIVRVVAGILAAGTLSGCASGGVTSLPLPGGADVGSHPFTIKARFSNVLNLVPQSAVKVNDVAVGRVTKVSLPKNGWTAEVTLVVNGDVNLPANSYAQLKQSSLLGEKYIALAPPPQGSATGRLGNGATIPEDRTNRNPEVEEVFGALSMLLNGGGLNQLHTITTELNKALNGNEPQVKDLLGQVAHLSSTLNANRNGITDALDGLNRLSATVNGRRDQLNRAIDDLTPGLKVLEQQRGALVDMLRALDRLSGVAVNTVQRSRADLVADLKALEPTLRRLAQSGDDLPNALQVLLTYPFTDSVMPAVKGDYLNTYLRVTAVDGTTVVPPVGGK
ncbi:MCE family protein [Actinomadura rupiterrae]|uniref:MCE family protein n=1 Tax=Actinomadura rupiterrae TaxID=559627 RepID=UPI0020A3751C|nr:MCE family protein [Actinomadura rupiterrae]MCP2339120.1 phospholipid/cholesterol/gamma-HCH transport system substrate-binding protein [Actinomadura rupiterrae]